MTKKPEKPIKKTPAQPAQVIPERPKPNVIGAQKSIDIDDLKKGNRGKKSDG